MMQLTDSARVVSLLFISTTQPEALPPTGLGWRLVPLAGVLFFLGLGVGVRIWLQVRRYGSSGFALFRAGDVKHNLIGSAAVLLCLTLLAEALAAAFWPAALAALTRSSLVIDPVALRPVGAALLFGGTGLMFLAQLDLGRSWRMGIDERAPSGLVTAGVYRFCRNPIYVFLFAALAGFTLLVPNWLSEVMLASTVVGFRQTVIHLEEPYLLRTYGEEYRSYAARVGRFLPLVGRLR